LLYPAVFSEEGSIGGWSGHGLWPQWPRPAGGRKQCTVLPHITASVFINDDERGLHTDYEKWLDGLAPHAPISQYRHNRTGEDNANAHLKRQVMVREVVVAVTNDRLDFGTWKRIFQSLAEWLGGESRWPAAEAGVGPGEKQSLKRCRRSERHTPFRTFAPHFSGQDPPDLRGSAYGLPPGAPPKPPAAEPAVVTILVMAKLATCVPPV
jgi:secondary thiamine-phosphate synthase enzyme